MKNKILNIYRQFGKKSLLWRIIRSLIRPIIDLNKYIILIVPIHKSKPCSKETVKALEYEDIEEMYIKAMISRQLSIQLKNFLANGSYGYLFKENKVIKGYAFVQNEGEYEFGRLGKFYLGEKFYAIKNLFVFPQFRGQSVGKILNIVRLSGIPSEKIPVGFVVHDNRYALRNLEMYGFEKCIKIRTLTFLRKYYKLQVIKQYRNDNFSKLVLEGLNMNL